MGIFVPIAWYTELYDPTPWKNFITRWSDPNINLTVWILCSALFIVPTLWMTRYRVLDLLALALAQQSLIFVGYFYMNLTAYNEHEAGDGILQMSGLCVILNTVGFAIFIATLLTVYSFVKNAHYQLPPLPAPADILDRKFLIPMRVLALVCAGSITLPMVLTHTVPLFTDDGEEARLQLVSSDTGRAVFHAGTALLPFTVGTLIVSALRRGLAATTSMVDLSLAGLAAFCQILTSDRLPLSITLVVTLSLLTTNFKYPRSLIFTIFVTYIFVFTFLSGYTSLMREKQKDSGGMDIVSASIQQAYLGDNLIDLRDGSWVLSAWDFHPLLGKTYLGGLFSFAPSGLFPQKKQWHLGLTAVRIVGLPEELHFGLRVSFFGEAFLNFGFAGVIALAVILGGFYGILLRKYHLSAKEKTPCVARSLKHLVLFQMAITLSNTSDAFISWILGMSFGVVFLWLSYAVKTQPILPPPTYEPQLSPCST